MTLFDLGYYLCFYSDICISLKRLLWDLRIQVSILEDMIRLKFENSVLVIHSMNALDLLMIHLPTNMFKTLAIARLLLEYLLLGFLFPQIVGLTLAISMLNCLRFIIE